MNKYENLKKRYNQIIFLNRQNNN